jgi:toxin CcdB
MAQFDVHKNLNPASKVIAPYIINMQSDLLDDLPTRLIAPLKSGKIIGGKIGTLMPEVEVLGKKYLVIVPESAGLPAHYLGPKVANLQEHRHQFVTAMDVLVTGI